MWPRMLKLNRSAVDSHFDSKITNDSLGKVKKFLNSSSYSFDFAFSNSEYSNKILPVYVNVIHAHFNVNLARVSKLSPSCLF